MEVRLEVERSTNQNEPVFGPDVQDSHAGNSLLFRAKAIKLCH